MRPLRPRDDYRAVTIRNRFRLTSTTAMATAMGHEVDGGAASGDYAGGSEEREQRRIPCRENLRLRLRASMCAPDRDLLGACHNTALRFFN
jgi:hypothetical protein